MLTRGQIITEGLSLAGRADLVSNARLWLNLYLDNVYRNQDVSWLLVSSENLPCTQSADLPVDYRAAKSASIGSQKTPLKIVDIDEFEMLRSGSTQEGQPLWVYLDLGEQTATFHPEPTAGTLWNLHYYALPELPDVTDALTDLEVPIWGLSFDILVQAVYVRALQYLDDQRADKAQQDLKAMFAESKMNSRDMRAGSSRFKLGKSFKRRF